jgi:Glycogen recognition site of AMP-activated protein kinase
MNTASQVARMSRASKRRVSIPATKTRIKVRFAVTPPIPLQIKYNMKTSAAIEHTPVTQSLFHATTRIENFTPVTNSNLDQTAFAELLLHPDQLEVAFRIAKSENDAFDASRTFGRSVNKCIPRTASPIRKSARQPSRPSRSELKITEFHLRVPFAESVKLAAEFTDWEKFPLDLIKSEDGVWHTNVPLPPGQYAYRFIVDGQWYDDPHPVQLVPNPFGTINAVVKVA